MCAEENGRESSARTSHPACFLHVPKCAGTAMTYALEAALPPGSLAPWRFDRDQFAPEDLDILPEETRALVLESPEDQRALLGYRAVAGHFSLNTLLSVAPPSAVCAVLREPRARLLSVYAFWRTLSTNDGHPSPAFRVAANARRPLAEFLADCNLVSSMDNQVCRIILGEDPRLPMSAFAAKSDMEGIAADAIQRLEEFGFVGILELGVSSWQGVGEHFGVSLRRQVLNVTGELGSAVSSHDAGEVLTEGALDLLDERTAADAMVYDYALERAGVASLERTRLKGRALASQLVRLGDLCGRSAVKVAQYDMLQKLGQELRRTDEQLASVRGSLGAIEGSTSWRATAPLRSAKRWIRGSRSNRTVAR
jgi:hypothetical protein